MKTIGGIIFAFFVLLVVCLVGVRTFGAEPMPVPGVMATPIAPKPLAAIVVSQCGGALALFIQLDANHLLRADSRQSDMFTNVDGKMVQSTADPMKWDAAYELAASAILTTHVTVPCDKDKTAT